jgi:hypothetical protein
VTRAELKLWAEFHLNHHNEIRQERARQCLEMIETGTEQNLRFAEVAMDNWFRPPGVPPREETT